MRRVTITLTDELEDAVDAFRRDQPATPSLTAVAQAAIREYLAQRGYVLLDREFWLTPAEQGSGRSDISSNHDDAFVEATRPRAKVS